MDFTPRRNRAASHRLMSLALFVAVTALLGVVSRTAADDESGEVLPPPESLIVYDDLGRPGMMLNGEFQPIYPPDVMRQKGIPVVDVAPQENAALVMMQACDLLTQIPTELDDAYSRLLDGAAISDDERAQLTDWVNNNRQALETARRAADMPQHATPYFGESTQPIFGILLPTLGEHRRMVRALAVESSLMRDRGETEMAMNNLISMQRMSAQMGEGFTLIEYLVGISESNLAMRMTPQILDSDTLDSATLDDLLIEYTAAGERFPEWSIAVQGELAAQRAFMDELMSAPNIIAAANFADFGGVEFGQANEGWGKLYVRLRKLYWPDRTARRQVNDFFGRLLGAAQEAEERNLLELPINEEAVMEESIAPWNIVAQLTVPALGRSFTIAQLARENHTRARLRVAIAAFERRHGRPPNSLNELVPRYIEAVPVNPETNAPHVYHADEPGGGADFAMIDTGNMRRPATAIAAAPQQPKADRQEASPQSVTGDSVPDAAQQGESSAARAAPADLTEWARYVEAYIERYQLSDSQANTARAMLIELEQRAENHMRVNGRRIIELKAARARAGSDSRRVAAADRDLEKLQAPLHQMFEELKRRLDTLPTRVQRDAADRKTSSDKP